MAKAKKFEQKFQVRFSMGQLDYERYHKILLAIDNYAVIATQHSEYLLPYLGSVKQFYRQVRTILTKDMRKKYDIEFVDVEDSIVAHSTRSKGLTAPAKMKQRRDILTKIGELNEMVLIIKQNIGLGIVIHKKETLQKQIERALTGG